MTDEPLLIDRARKGDQHAFRELVERSKGNVYRLAYDVTGDRHDAEDLSQEVFIRVYGALSDFRGEAKWSTWLYRITVNVCLDHKRAMKRKPVLYENRRGDENPGDTIPSPGIPTPEQSAESVLLQEHIDRALKVLTRQERIVFVLRHYHDLPLKQIAETMQIAEGTVKSYLFRAIHRLKKELTPYRREFGIQGVES